jgi:hypothetical protein
MIEKFIKKHKDFRVPTSIKTNTEFSVDFQDLKISGTFDRLENDFGNNKMAIIQYRDALEKGTILCRNGYQ